MAAGTIIAAKTVALQNLRGEEITVLEHFLVNTSHKPDMNLF
jgi:hypothetical protein